MGNEKSNYYYCYAGEWEVRDARAVSVHLIIDISGIVMESQHDADGDANHLPQV